MKIDKELLNQARQLLIERTRERNNDFIKYGDYSYAPFTLEDCINELAPKETI